jgi:hypothetical protein
MSILVTRTSNVKSPTRTWDVTWALMWPDENHSNQITLPL